MNSFDAMAVKLQAQQEALRGIVELVDGDVRFITVKGAGLQSQIFQPVEAGGVSVFGFTLGGATGGPTQ